MGKIYTNKYLYICWNVFWCLWFTYLAIDHYIDYGMKFFLPILNLIVAYIFGQKIYKFARYKKITL